VREGKEGREKAAAGREGKAEKGREGREREGGAGRVAGEG
jgi:hypothetical protein